MSQKKKDDSSSNLIFIILLGLGILIYFGLYKVQTTGRSSSSSSANSLDGDLSKEKAVSADQELRRINNHLFLQAQKQDLEKMKQNIKNHQTAPDIGSKEDSERQLLTGKGVQFETDLRQKKMQRDTGRPDKPIEIKELHQVVSAEVAKQNLKIKKSEIIQDNYAENYIQYARERGYDVKLQRIGDHYVVESVTPLRQPGSEFTKKPDEESEIDSNDDPEDQGAQ